MKILGINISHHPSVCVYENNKIKEFYNEERFILKKKFQPDKDTEIYQSLLQKLNFKPDLVCYASFGRNNEYYDCTDIEIINKLQSQLNNPPYYFNIKEHHLYHAVSAFYFSSFDDAAAIIIDGGGACKFYIPFQEVESIYLVNKKNIVPFYKHSTSYRSYTNILESIPTYEINKYINGFLNKFSNQTRGGIDFLNACKKIGFEGEEDAGKVMGLSSYAYTNDTYQLDYSKVKIAKDVQEKTFNETCELIELVKHRNKNIILSGGYFLNCSNNFKYVKKYPELNFFVDPIPHDAGTAIGVAIYYDNYKK